ncbi:hypothetical protein BH10PLA1_BH10PLA1_18870 [soil metagenome]
MSDLSSLGLVPFAKLAPAAPAREWIEVQKPLRRVLRFTGRSIDDIVNSRIVKNEIIGYYKLQKFIDRRMEIVDLEKQWNAIR